MTVQVARNILGDYGKSLKDEHIQSIIDSFNGIIEVGLRQFEKCYKVELGLDEKKEQMDI